MHKLSPAWLLLAAVACGACEGSAVDDTPVDPFVGRWSCTETRTLKFTTPAGAPDATSKNVFILNSAIGADGHLSTYATTEAGAPCALRFTENGMSAVLMTGQ
jgi:hypothetical protein